MEPPEFHLEPATAARVARAIGAGPARVFDVVNACAGMLTGIFVLQGLIRAGEARCGMVVAGEHNLPVTRTAARELRHRFDGQMAALTLGDGGAAVILDASPDPARVPAPGLVPGPARPLLFPALTARAAASW
jgi:3-oxoacyl-[acyl-carrier-protein] synthase-3